jgi:hypothetical protein
MLIIYSASIYSVRLVVVFPIILCFFSVHVGDLPMCTTIQSSLVNMAKVTWLYFPQKSRNMVHEIGFSTYPVFLGSMWCSTISSECSCSRRAGGDDDVEEEVKSTRHVASALRDGRCYLLLT